MKCLCCNREILTPTESELRVKWHDKCIKKFFGSSRMPEIRLSEDELEALAKSTVSKGLTVPGVQKKLSLRLGNRSKRPRLTIVNYPAGYILKPASEEYAHLPEAEFLGMKLGEAVGIKTVPNALVEMYGQYAYLTRRIDRPAAGMLAMEDFCQLSGRLTEDKYKGSYESCGRIIDRYSKNIGLDRTEFFYRLLFSFAIGNSDMHLKNFSLIEDAPASRVFGLSAAYDMLPVNLIMPADQDQMALTVNGKKRNLRKKDFFSLAESLGINENVARKLMHQLAKHEDAMLELVQDSYLPEEMRTEMSELIRERMAILKP